MGQEEEAQRLSLQLAGLEAGARSVLCKDLEMGYRNWMARELSWGLLSDVSGNTLC